MKKNTSLFICLFLLFLLSLTSWREYTAQENDIVTVNAEFTDRMEIRMSEFIESIEFTPLETDPYYLVSTIRKIECTPDRYYIGTTMMGDMSKILIFDKTGKYLHQVTRIGEGPDEFPYISDFCINQEGNLFITSRFKNLTLDPDGKEVIAIEPTPTYANLIGQTKDKMYLYTKGRTLRHAQDGSTHELLTAIDLLTKKEQRFFLPSEDLMNRVRGTGLTNHFSVCDERVYFTYPYCDTIFDISKNQLKPAFYIDFGKRKRPKEIYKDWEDTSEKITEIRRHGGIWNIWSFHIGKNYLFFEFNDYRYEFYIVLYNRNTNQTKMGNVLIDDLYFKDAKLIFTESFEPDFQAEDGKLLWTIEPSYLLETYEAYKKRVSAADWQTFQAKHPSLVSLCDNLKEDDNPVLLTINLK